MKVIWLQRSIIVMILFVVMVRGQDRVYVDPDILYLDKIARILEQNNYRMFMDSTKADWMLEINSEVQKDSLKNTILLVSKQKDLTKNIAVFTVQQLSKKETRISLRKHIFWNLFAAISLSLLFFIRT